MVLNRARYGLLVQLAWELNRVPLACRIQLPRNGEPVLYVQGAYGRYDAVLACQRDGLWRVLWKGREFDVGRLDVTARRIAGEAVA